MSHKIKNHLERELLYIDIDKIRILNFSLNFSITAHFIDHVCDKNYNE